MSRKVIDIEGNSLLANMLDYSSLPYKLLPTARMWTVVIRDIDTGETFCKNRSEITKQWMRETLKGTTLLVAHNGIKFDFVVLYLFDLLEYTIGYPGQSSTLFGEPVEIVDTLILSRLFNPDRFGGHSLDSWGKRTGEFKIDFRQACIDQGLITKDSPRGSEFAQWSPLMDEYCIGDTVSTVATFKALEREWKAYDGWDQAIAMENKLADLAIRRETFGFWFDRELALKCLEDLTEKMDTITKSINPILPDRPMIKGELSDFTPPKKQLTIKNEPTATVIKFAEKVGGYLTPREDEWYLTYKGSEYKLPYYEPLETHVEATIDNLDWVKMHLISLGWEPTEWRERDLTKDSKKQNLPRDKRITAMTRWVKETTEGKYRDQRLKIVEIPEQDLIKVLSKKLLDDKPVKVPTSPCIRVGVEKELCPNLVKLGEKVAFAKDFALYLTYKHRKSSIAGGDIEDMDFDEETPNTGFLSMYRDADGRVSTPAIEIGASTNRYRHIGICNIARATSVYGKEMRSLFGSGSNGYELGFDFASLEARIQGHYCWKYTDGEQLAEDLLAEKPNDIHTKRALVLDIKRDDAKSVNYMLLYGGQIAKVMKMLACDKARATEIFDGFWDNTPALKELREAVERFWLTTDKTYILGIDGRKIMTRSKHSLLNALFQSAGVICAKYVTILMFQELEEKGYCTNPFEGMPYVLSMIEYHDEAQLFVHPSLIQFKIFKDKEEGEKFKEEWKGDQLSALTEGKQWYVALPNDISRSINNAIRKTEKITNLNVPLGYEWVVNKTWYGCH